MHVTNAVKRPDSNNDLRRRCRYRVYRSSNCEFSPVKIYNKFNSIEKHLENAQKAATKQQQILMLVYSKLCWHWQRFIEVFFVISASIPNEEKEKEKTRKADID